MISISAGDPEGVIPQVYELSKGRFKLARRNANTPRFRQKGCEKLKPSSTLATLLTTASNTTEDSTIAATDTTPTTEKRPSSSKRPKTTPKKPNKKPKPNPKKPKRPNKKPKPTPNKPNKRTRRPTAKPTKKPRGGPKPNVTTKPNVTPKPCKNQSTTKPPFSFTFFSRFSQVLNGLGFQSRVVRTKPC